MHPEVGGHEFKEVVDVSKLNKQLINWVAERLISRNPKLLEAKARFVIAKAITEDVRNKEKYDKLLVIERTKDALQRLIDQGLTDSTPIVVANKDSLHPEEEYNTAYEMNESSFLAKEVSATGETISCAVIFKNGDTLLTINPQGERFLNGNPKIILSPNFPRSTVETFNLLVGSQKIPR